MPQNQNAQYIIPSTSTNPVVLHEHQLEALAALDALNERKDFQTLLVLPTGGGKTLTAVWWLLEHAVNERRKILWLAHRHLLLEQAAESFYYNSYSQHLPRREGYNYRIISGEHDRPIHVKETDDVLIVGKDSLNGLSEHVMDGLNRWVEGASLVLVIDEAHHATAKTYRKIIQWAEDKSSSMSLLGLTATPFRTSEQEKGLLGKLFKDDIVYKVDLKTLIEKKILAVPDIKEIVTSLDFKGKLSSKAMQTVYDMDVLPVDIIDKIASDSLRNHLIVNTYLENKEQYGQTILFAVNRLHALTLQVLFEKNGRPYGVKSGVIISGSSQDFIGIDHSNEENKRTIESYKKGDIQILINVNILTEGTDLPKTQSVFLTRPTSSSILMTQMVGRALRGPKAGGTDTAYIVSFIDEWDKKMAWISPERLFDAGDFVDSISKVTTPFNRIISIKALSEFARMMDQTIDHRDIENMSFRHRIPLGMYHLDYLDPSGNEKSKRILIYEHHKDELLAIIQLISRWLKELHIDGEVLTTEQMSQVIAYIKEYYPVEESIYWPGIDDFVCLVEYIATKDCDPCFEPIQIEVRDQLDATIAAEVIVRENMTRRQIMAYVKNIWENSPDIVQPYYDNMFFLLKQIDIEKDKLLHPSDYVQLAQRLAEDRLYEDMTLEQIKRHDATYAQQIRKYILDICRTWEKGHAYYVCNQCGGKFGSAFIHVDHIKPMAKGGKTVIANLQPLCRTCNLQKGDREDET